MREGFDGRFSDRWPKWMFYESIVATVRQFAQKHNKAVFQASDFERFL